MSRIAYVNGAYVPSNRARISIDDRGFQFADSICEVVTVYHGAFIDMDDHMDRLERSLRELSIHMPMSRAALMFIMKEVARRNHAYDAILYLQISRGVAKRDHAFPALSLPSIVMTCHRFPLEAMRAKSKVGIKAISQSENRWARCDIKSTSLLPNILAKQAAKEAGAAEAIFIDKDGTVTEGSSTNIWMVTKDGTLVTRSTNDNILPGITRRAVLKLAAELQLTIEERTFTLTDALKATELFLTSSTNCVMPIVTLDGNAIQDEKPGPISTRLAESYWSMMENTLTQ